jgi:hypothetical protein
MTQQMDVFLREFIGFRQDQITRLDIDWEPCNEGLHAGHAAPTPAGSPVLVYQAPDGGLRSKPLTEDALHRCREALMADLQQLGSLSSSDPLPRPGRRRRPAQAHRDR